MSSSRYKGGQEKREKGQFLALPRVVLLSTAYRGAGYAERALLLDIAMQYNGANNGSLTACAKYLRPLGWTSNDTVSRARKSLLDAGLLIETRKGARPNRAAWYALPWHDIDRRDGMDIDPAKFPRWRNMEPLRDALAPATGATGRTTAPKSGAGVSPLAPKSGAVVLTVPPVATPKTGAYLETPSACAPVGVQAAL